MNYLKSLWCKAFDHDWRRAKKGEALGPYRICRRCGETKTIVQRVKVKKIEGVQA